MIKSGATAQALNMPSFLVLKKQIVFIAHNPTEPVVKQEILAI